MLSEKEKKMKVFKDNECLIIIAKKSGEKLKLINHKIT